MKSKIEVKNAGKIESAGKFIQVSLDQWADFLSELECYGTEPSRNVMRHKNRAGETLAEVVYGDNGDRTYWILDASYKSDER